MEYLFFCRGETTVKPNNISFYNIIEKDFNTERKERSIENLKDNRTLGLVCFSARKRMSSAVTNIIFPEFDSYNFAKFKLQMQLFC